MTHKLTSPIDVPTKELRVRTSLVYITTFWQPIYVSWGRLKDHAVYSAQLLEPVERIAYK